MRRSVTKRWASRRTTIPTLSCRSATRWGGSDRLTAGPCPKSSISTAGASPTPESDQAGFGGKARETHGKAAAGNGGLDSPEQGGLLLPWPRPANDWFRRSAADG